MSDKHTILRSAVIRLPVNFFGGVILKYDKFPTTDEKNLELYSKARQEAKDNGASDRTLDDLESYVKKIHLKIVECDDNKLTALTDQIVKEVLAFHGEKAKKDGSNTLYIIED